MYLQANTRVRRMLRPFLNLPSLLDQGFQKGVFAPPLPACHICD